MEKKYYRWVLPNDEIYQTRIKNHEFENDWFRLDSNGGATVKAGYASDGNSPKILIGKVFYIGPPDGEVDTETLMPSTYRAFFIHDALLQFYEQLGIKKQKAHPEYCKEVRRTRFPLRHIYCLAVTLFGPHSN